MPLWIAIISMLLLSMPAAAGQPASLAELNAGGGIVLGRVSKIGSSWIVPIRCALAGGIEGIETRVQNRKIFFRVISGAGSPMCPDVTLLLPGGTYEAYYDDLSGAVPLGTVHLVK